MTTTDADLGHPDPGLQLRQAAFDELDPATLYEILRLRVDVFVVEQDCPFGDLDGRDREPSCRHLWVEQAGTPVAYLRVLDEPDGATQIGRVVTRPEVRSVGVAAALMRAAMAGIEGPIVLKAQARVADWYGHFGFEVDGAEFLEDGIPHLPMRYGPA